MASSSSNQPIEWNSAEEFDYTADDLTVLDELIGVLSGLKKFRRPNLRDLVEHPLKPLTFMNRRVRVENLRRFHLQLGGRWQCIDDFRLYEYKVGTNRFIYHINPQDFNMGRLIHMVTKLACWKGATMVWYQACGTEYGKELKPLCNNDDMDEMWLSMDTYNRDCGIIYFQECEFEWKGNEEKGLPPTYTLPTMIQKIPLGFDIDYYIETTTHYQLQDLQLGAKLICQQEIRGERSCITYESYPRMIKPDFVLGNGTMQCYSKWI